MTFAEKVNAFLDKVRPPMPFDLEPPIDRIPISTTQMKKDDELRQAYEDIRLWHALKKIVGG